MVAIVLIWSVIGLVTTFFALAAFHNNTDEVFPLCRNKLDGTFECNLPLGHTSDHECDHFVGFRTWPNNDK